MCGRFTLTLSGGVLASVFETAEVPSSKPRYNIAPTQVVPALRWDEDRGRSWFDARWGLIPFWAKDIKIGARLINARSETASKKPAFRNAVKRQRCIIPADGFFEWKKVGGTKQPQYIHFADKRLFAFAGLWESWQNLEGLDLLSCTILTTEPNELVGSIHNRMPVILKTQDFDEWLNPQPLKETRLSALTQAFPAGEMRAFPVSTLVSSVYNDKPECIEPHGQQSLW